MGALSPKQQDFRRSTSLRPAKGPKETENLSNLMGTLRGGKPLVPKRKGKSIFAPYIQEVSESQAPLI